MLVRNSQGSFYNNLSNNVGDNLQISSYGRVYHTVIDQYSAGYKDWSSIGNVYYINYTDTPPSKKEITNDFLASKPFAKSLLPNYINTPVNGELILLLYGLPNIESSDIQNQNTPYYLSSINLYNNTNHNSPATFNLNEDGSADLGKNIIESTTIGNLFPFEGDNIIQGRWGNGIRFSSTLKENNLENFWSITGNTGDPITLLVNGYNFTPDLKGKPYVEDINSDKSSLYLTSTQTIPIDINNTTNNPLFSITDPSIYYNSQAILNANRILINSNKDEILLYSKTNILISSKNTTYISANQNILINGGQYIFLGIDSKGNIPTEPVLLGDKTITLLNDLLNNLKLFASSLNNVVDNQNRPLLSLTIPASSLRGSMDNIINKLEEIKSKKVYTL
jgi:hypothetical protein